MYLPLFILHVGNLSTDKIIVIALIEYLTSEDVGQPLGKSLAWPARWLVDGTVGQKKPSKSDSQVTKTNGGKWNKLL